MTTNADLPTEPSTRLAGLLQGRRMVLFTLLIGGFTAFGPLSMDLYLPAFPALADQFGTTEAAVQLTLTADVIGLLIGQLILGPMSDAWGRRRLLLGSTLVCAVASVLCALAPSIGWLVVWRFLQGLAGAERKAEALEQQPASTMAGHVLEPQVRLHATASSRACMSSSDRPK